MKKLCLLMVASMFMLGDVCLARVDSNSKDMDERQVECYTCGRPMKKCKCKKEKAVKEKKHKKEKVKKEKVHKVKVHKQEKPKKEHKAKEHKPKEHKVKEHKAKKEKVHKQEKVKKEHKVKEHKPKKVKMHKEEKKHEKRQANHEKKRNHEEKAKQRALKNEAKSMHKQEREHHKRVTGEQREEEVREELLAAAHNKRQTVTQERAERRHMMATWERAHDEAEHRDLTAGKYSDLYILPAIPQYAYWYEGGKTFFNADFHYDYACNAYGSDGGSSKRNITQLAFGEDQITFSGIALALNLFNQGLVANNGGLEFYRNSDVSDNISFIGKDEKYQLDLEIGRYIINRDVAIGLNVPVLYSKHKLKSQVFVDSSTGGDNQDFYTTTLPVFLKNLLLAKGFTEMGGSAMGLGDISVYANYQINSVHFEKLVLGVRCVVPTGKKASTSKLWAPELGNGGFFEASAFGAVAMNYQKYLNPFVTLEGGFSAAAHVPRRVPRLVSVATVAPALAAPTQAQFDQANVQLNSLAFGSRVQLLDDNAVVADRLPIAVGSDEGILGFSGYDATVKGFADQVSTVKVTPGPELKFRVGNTMERFIWARGFLDVFYDFRAKGQDKATGLSTDTYDLSVLTKHTVELDHKLGIEYSYQHDLYTRTHVGILYTFAGMNVPKTFEVGGSFNYAF